MKRIILVTGASQGIGSKITEEFAKNGDDVIAFYNNSEQEAKALKERVEASYNTNVDLIKCDLSNSDELENTLKKISDNYKKIDVLVNNAGLSLDNLLELKNVEDFKHILDVNLIAPFRLSQYFGSLMYQQRQGIIINISSTNGIDTEYVEGLDYDASKAGLISLTKNFAKAYAPYVRVNCIASGWVNTKMNENMSSEFKELEEDKILLGRFAEASEIAKVVIFLSSNDASYINGSIIRVDGGKK